jgi:hypothetical protein
VRRGEWVVQRIPAVFHIVPIEHRKVDHPQWRPLAVHDAQVMTNADTQGTKRIVHYLA